MKRSLCVAVLQFLWSPSNAQQPPWRLAEGTEGTILADIEIFPSNPDTMFAIGSQFLISTDRGEQWRPLEGPLADDGAVRVDSYNSRIIYASHYGLSEYGNDISITTDGGTTWTREFIGRGWSLPFVEIDPIGHRSVYAGVGPGMIFRTSDVGATWEQLPGPPGIGLVDFVIAPSDGNVMLAANLVQVFKSEDRGSTWRELFIGLPVHLGASLAIDPRDPSVFYAGVHSLLGYPGGLFKSTNGGISWFELNIGLIPDFAVTIEINPRRPEEIFVGVLGVLNEALMRSTDAGDSWLSFANGLPDSVGVRTMAIDTTTGKMIAGVIGLTHNGIYLLDPEATAVDARMETVPQSSALVGNYPNPFNNSTVISFALASRSHVRLDVYSVSGAKVATILEGEREAGHHRVVFSGPHLASGLYFVRLQTPLFTQLHPMVLVK
jgi:photosystem II stability/assembly factor-like uncharacterized protein